MPLSREEMAAKAAPGAPVELEVPLMGGSVLIKTWTGAERDQWDLFVLQHSWTEEDEEEGLGKAGRLRDDTKHIRAVTCQMGLVLPDGSHMFTDSEADLNELSGWRGDMLDFIYAAIRKHNGLTVDEVEDERKNSDPGPSDVSG